MIFRTRCLCFYESRRFLEKLLIKMENFDDFENKSYEKASVVKYTAAEYFKFIVRGIVIVFQVLSLAVVAIFENLFRSKKPKNISGQLALVTGSANGLGREIALRLAREGCNIIIVDLNLNEAQKTAAEISEKFKVKTVAFKVDVSDYEAIQQLKKDIEKSLGDLDILVNNAGILSAISFREGSPSDVQKLIDVNLSSHFWTVRTFLNKMIDRKRGHIVAISSLSGKISFPLACGYCATKFGVRGFMNALYDELCAYENDEYIKTTCVFPAFINTRKQLGDLLDQIDEISPRMTPEYAADEIVKGMLLDKRDVTIPNGAWLMQIVK